MTNSSLSDALGRGAGHLNGKADGSRKKPKLLPTPFNELYVVITEGRADLVTFAERLKKEMDKVTDDNCTVIATKYAQGALEVGRAYGHVPLVLMIGNKKEGGQAHAVLPVISTAYQQLAGVHNVFHLSSGVVVDELNKSNLDSAVETTVKKREEQLRVREAILSAKSVDDLVSLIDTQVEQTLPTYPNIKQAAGLQPKVVKLGGSIYDLIRSKEGANVFSELIEELANLEKQKRYNIILTVGGGPFYDPAKQAKEYLELSDEQARKQARTALRQQAVTLVDMLSKWEVPAQIIETTTLLQAIASVVNGGQPTPYVPVVLTIPRDYPDAEFTAHPEESDKLAIALAHYFNAPNVIFVKDAEGVHLRDPNLTQEQIAALPEKFRRGPNCRFARIYAQDIAAGKISRIGSDGRNGHLIDDSALEVLINSMRVGSVQVVNGRKPEEVTAAISGGTPAGSYILK